MGPCGSAAKVVAVSLIVLYGILPVILYFVPHVHVYLLYLHFVKWPFIDYSNPQQMGVKAFSRNFYLDVDDDSVGIWQILPKDVAASRADEFERALSNTPNPIIVYNHGNCWSRCAPHRMKLYNLLSNAGYHVIAFDYRGYGDSPGFPSEEGMIKDAVVVYEWARARAGSNPIFVWGHSLGTAISTAAVAALCDRDRCPQGLILEAPFNNLTEVVRHHFFSAVFRWLPWADKFLVEPPLAYGLRFDTDEKIKRVTCPVMILHAKDDFIIPFHLADKLYKDAKGAGVDASFVEFDQHGHKYICNAPELPKLINEFVGKSMVKPSKTTLK